MISSSLGLLCMPPSYLNFKFEVVAVRVHFKPRVIYCDFADVLWDVRIFD